jgi:hypothetical protein
VLELRLSSPMTRWTSPQNAAAHRRRCRGSSPSTAPPVRGGSPAASLPLNSSKASRPAASCPRRCAILTRSDRSAFAPTCRSRQTFVSVAIDAPREGRAKGRFNWLIRQLKQAPDDLLIEASFPNARTTTIAKLGDVRDKPTSLYYAADPKREPRGFLLTQSKPMGQKHGRAEGSFVRETSAQIATFYRNIVQNLRAWDAPAPKLRAETEDQGDAPETEPALAPVWGADEVLTSSMDSAPVHTR